MSTTELQPQQQTTRLPRLQHDSAGLLMTPEEFDAITDYDECYRYELIHGVLVVNAIPLESQASPNDQLGYLLNFYKESHPQGAALDETLPERYIRCGNSRRLADRVIWAGLGRVPDPDVDIPTIAVEFVSAGKRNWRRDYEIKRDEYLEAGVVEYWIIDRFTREMTIYTKGAAGPVKNVVPGNEKHRTELLPGFELPLARLLAAADRWKRRK